MKKILAFILSAAMLVSLCAVSASAESTDSAQVYISISDKDGKLAVTAEKITVTDSDSDGALTISDALYAAHEAFYDGGAAEGYAASVTEYGLGLQKLWGSANGGSYGYYVNNASAWALTDLVKDGDYVAAFVYTDLVGWSDNYSYFDSYMGEAEEGEEITLTYLRAGYDKDWNPVTLPVEGAVITVDGEAADITTDSQGKATIAISEGGRHLVSATYDSARLMAPVFIAIIPLIGDADSDNMVTILDATRIQRWLAELDGDEKVNFTNADADGDGEVTILDATRIQRTLAGLEAEEK